MNERLIRREKIVSPIEHLPTDILLLILDSNSYLSCADRLKLCQASSILAHCIRLLHDQLAKKLLSHVVKGEEEQAIAMIRANPILLLRTSSATDYSGRRYTERPLQAALLCLDAQLGEKMVPFFKGLSNGQMQIKSQFDAVFPQGLPVKKESYDFSQLILTITRSSALDIEEALQKIQNHSTLCAELNHFRKEFKSLVIKEPVFNPSHLATAYFYFCTEWDNWSLAQRDLFRRQVIGYVQRFIPACFAKNFVRNRDWSPYMTNHSSINFPNHLNKFFPLQDSAGLGFDFAVSHLGDTENDGSELLSRSRGLGERENFNRVTRLHESRMRNENYLINEAENPWQTVHDGSWLVNACLGFPLLMFVGVFIGFSLTFGSIFGLLGVTALLAAFACCMYRVLSADALTVLNQVPLVNLTPLIG